MNKIVIFGMRDFAQLALYYLTHDSPYEVAAFSVSQQYMAGKNEFEGLPLVPFENVEQLYPADTYDFFVPMSPTNMNRDRAKVYLEVKNKGYALISYVSSRSIILPGTVIGENCFIWENNTVQPFAKIGNNVTICSGNIIGHHAQIGDHVFLANTVLTGHTVVGPYCFFGVNSCVRECLNIAEGTYVAMNAAVACDTEPWSVYGGSIAEKQGKSSLEM